MQQPAAPMFKVLLDTTEDARAIALEEIKELRKDLAALERILSGRARDDDFPLLDVAHGALEIFRTASVVLDNQRLLAGMQDAVDRALAEEFLAANGARLLREPEGWHWFSKKGVMRHPGPGRRPDGRRRAPEAPPDAPAAPDAPAPAVADAAPAPEATRRLAPRPNQAQGQGQATGERRRLSPPRAGRPAPPPELSPQKRSRNTSGTFCFFPPGRAPAAASGAAHGVDDGLEVGGDARQIVGVAGAIRPWPGPSRWRSGGSRRWRG